MRLGKHHHRLLRNPLEIDGGLPGERMIRRSDEIEFFIIERNDRKPFVFLLQDRHSKVRLPRYQVFDDVFDPQQFEVQAGMPRVKFTLNGLTSATASIIRLGRNKPFRSSLTEQPFFRTYLAASIVHFTLLFFPPIKG